MQIFVLDLLMAFSNIGVALVIAGLLVIAFNEPQITTATKLLTFGIMTVILSSIAKAIIDKED